MAGSIHHPPAITPEQLDLIAELIEDGMSHFEIAKTVGVSAKRITRRFPGTQWTPKQRSELGVLVRKSNRRIKKQFAHVKGV